jgi:hypothetical protein
LDLFVVLFLERFDHGLLEKYRPDVSGKPQGKFMIAKTPETVKDHVSFKSFLIRLVLDVRGGLW